MFISGGGSGIGHEFARQLAQEGADIAIFNRKLAPQVIEELQRLAVRPDQKFRSYSADVSDDVGLTGSIDDAVHELGAPDLAINSAGLNIAKPFVKLTSSEFNHVININLIGSRNFAAAVMPHLRPGAHLVFIASLASMVGTYAYTAYCASKFGVMGLASCLRVELKLKSIDVSICCPGEIMTPFVHNEHKTLDPILFAMKAFAGKQEVDVACAQMLHRIARRQFEIVDGVRPGITAWLARHLPGTTRLMTDDIARKITKKSLTPTL
ncbi:SDR family NAD(P)-dependent oxidoreductase [Rhodoferax sp. 4810]|nr:SDR family NAD(P)-dependent oxidoreductase [Rhodoferax jenense]